MLSISNSKSPKPRIDSLGNTDLPQVRSCFNLGVIIDDKLTFSNHILSTTKKAYTQSAIMSRCFLSKNPHLLTRAFTSYVRPILEYASPVWSPHFTKDIDGLEREFNVVSPNHFTIFVQFYILLASSDTISSHFTFAVLILILPLVTALFMNSLVSILHSSLHFAYILSLAVIHYSHKTFGSTQH